MQKVIDMKMSPSMVQALTFLNTEEYYLVDIDYQWQTWLSYGSSGHIKTTTMKALEKRELVKVDINTSGGRGSKVAKITNKGKSFIE